MTEQVPATVTTITVIAPVAGTIQRTDLPADWTRKSATSILATADRYKNLTLPPRTGTSRSYGLRQLQPSRPPDRVAEAVQCGRHFPTRRAGRRPNGREQRPLRELAWSPRPTIRIPENERRCPGQSVPLEGPWVRIAIRDTSELPVRQARSDRPSTKTWLWLAATYGGSRHRKPEPPPATPRSIHPRAGRLPRDEIE